MPRIVHQKSASKKANFIKGRVVMQNFLIFERKA